MGMFAVHVQARQIDLKDAEGARAQDHRGRRSEREQRRREKSRKVDTRRAQKVEQGHKSG